MVSSNSSQWVCCQLGAREHYAVARALALRQRLAALITDTWVGSRHPLRIGPWDRLKQRYHVDLAGAKVISWSFETAVRTRLYWQGLGRWERITAQNEWFSRKAAAAVAEVEVGQGTGPVVFCYSYTAGPVFVAAKRRGCRTVLGQIDGGIIESQLVQALHESCPNTGSSWTPAPTAYWEKWREELRLADLVLVNSQWSGNCLVESGSIDKERVAVVPLAYSPPDGSAGFTRTYPARFTAARPMKVLFLGQITLRKGVLPIFEAIRTLSGSPIDFVFVGPVMVAVPPEVRANPRVRFAGPFARSEVARFYRDTDVFLFPTFSDGFGLTQLEAQAWKLPIIASRFCGEVVNDGVNGIILTEVTAAKICAALRQCLLNPDCLAGFSHNSVPLGDFSVGELGRRMSDLLQDRSSSFNRTT